MDHGINMAQRCMDAGDNDHILISNEMHINVGQMDIAGLKLENWGQVFVTTWFRCCQLHTAYGNRFRAY